jgi:hypothetical protein
MCHIDIMLPRDLMTPWVCIDWLRVHGSNWRCVRACTVQYVRSTINGVRWEARPRVVGRELPARRQLCRGGGVQCRPISYFVPRPQDFIPIFLFSAAISTFQIPHYIYKILFSITNFPFWIPTYTQNHARRARRATVVTFLAGHYATHLHCCWFWTAHSVA